MKSGTDSRALSMAQSIPFTLLTGSLTRLVSVDQS